MIDSARAVPFSLSLCAGLLVRPLPLAPLQFVLARAVAIIARQRPSLFDGLRAWGRPVFLIDPIDFPFVFLFEPTADPPVVRVRRDSRGAPAAATVAAPLAVLLALLRGEIDGDAAFFTRSLTITGDTEAVLALNNALDGIDLDLGSDLAPHLGPLAARAASLIDRYAGVLKRVDEDVRLLGMALIGPTERRLEAETRYTRALEARIATLERKRPGEDRTTVAARRP